MKSNLITPRETKVPIKTNRLCSFARLNGESSFIAVESEEIDCFEFGNPFLHPECGHES